MMEGKTDTMPAERQLIAYCMGGLANRLCTLLNAMVVCGATGRDLLVFWDETEFGCRISWDRLFQNKCKFITSAEIQSLKDPEEIKILLPSRSMESNRKVYHRNELDILESRGAIRVPDPVDLLQRLHFHQREAIKQYELSSYHTWSDEFFNTSNPARVIIFHHWEWGVISTPRAIRNFAQLLPVEDIRVRIEEFVEQNHLTSNDWLVHIRATDFAAEHASSGGIPVVAVAKWISNAIDKDPQQRMLLISDSLEIEAAFHKKYPKNIMIREGKRFPTKGDETKGWHRNIVRDTESVIDALIDLKLAGRVAGKGATVVTDRRSSFGTLLHETHKDRLK